MTTTAQPSASAVRRRVLGIAGSLRAGSFNRTLLRSAASIGPASLGIELYDQLGLVPLFDEDLERETNGGPMAVRQLREKVKAADGLLISTPEYNQSVSGVLKNTIDWLSRPGPEEVLVGKPIAIMGASGGRWGTRLAQANLRQVLTATESLVMPQPAIFVAEGAKVFDANGELLSDLLRKQLEVFMVAFANWIAIMQRPASVES